MRLAAKIGLGILGALALMQVGWCEHTNPPVTGEIDAPADVKAVLKRACWDCHSNETNWRWYTYLAPASWLVHRDVYEGRKHLNFSEWSNVPEEKRAKKIASCMKQISKGDMPPWFYLPLHAAAKLSGDDKAILEGWVKTAGK
jgi:hypothetical protein